MKKYAWKELYSEDNMFIYKHTKLHPQLSIHSMWANKREPSGLKNAMILEFMLIIFSAF